MKKILILHGWGGSDYPHWQSWLASELAKDYGCVNFLKFADYDNPKIDIWSKQAKEALDSFSPNIVICHSLANILWFHLANNNKLDTVEHLYLVAPPRSLSKNTPYPSYFPIDEK